MRFWIILLVVLAVFLGGAEYFGLNGITTLLICVVAIVLGLARKKIVSDMDVIPWSDTS